MHSSGHVNAGAAEPEQSMEYLLSILLCNASRDACQCGPAMYLRGLGFHKHGVLKHFGTFHVQMEEEPDPRMLSVPGV